MPKKFAPRKNAGASSAFTLEGLNVDPQILARLSERLQILARAVESGLITRAEAQAEVWQLIREAEHADRWARGE